MRVVTHRAAAAMVLLLAVACHAPPTVEVIVSTSFDPLLLEIPGPARADFVEPDDGRLRLAEGWMVWDYERSVRQPLRKRLWSGQTASVDFVGVPAQDLDFVATLAPFVDDGGRQTVRFTLDGIPAGEWRLADGLHQHRLRLPELAATPGLHRLELRFSSAGPRDGKGSVRFAAAFTDLALVPSGTRAPAPQVPADPASPTRVSLDAATSLIVPLPTGSARLTFRGSALPTAMRYRVLDGPATARPWVPLEVGAHRPIEVELTAGTVPRKVELALGSAPSRSSTVTLEVATVPSLLRTSSDVEDGLRPPDLFLYVIDTLRADALGVYGAGRDTSLHLDRLARDGVVFEQAWSASSWTAPSTRALLTGVHPRGTGVDAAAGRAVLPLAERLRRRGYETVAIVQSQVVSPAAGFAVGFDTFYLADALGRCTNESRAVAWYLWHHLFHRRDPARPLFVYVHTVDPHGPYTPHGEDRRYVANPLAFVRRFAYDPTVFARSPEPRSRREIATMRGLYDGDVRRNDRSFGAFVELLDGLGKYADSAVVVTSDHGEEFGEHGGFGHGRTLFEEALRVPLILKLPGGRRAGTRVTTPVSGVDVVPTFLELAGASDSVEAGELEGRSLLRGGGDETPSPVWARVVGHATRTLPAVSIGAVRDGFRKCLVHPLGHDRFGRQVPRLVAFDLQRDPAESSPLPADEADRACRSLVAAGLSDLPAGELEPLDPQARAALEALGYL